MKQIALITGASSAIGSTIAYELANKGIDLILHYYQGKKQIDKLKKKCEGKGVAVKVIQADFTSYDQITQIFSQLNNDFIYPNILINAVGLSNYKLMQDVSYTEVIKLISINLTSMFFASQMVLPNMVKVKNGRIINLSSVWGEVGAANEVLYSMTKGGVNTFTKALAKELAPSGITVNAISPGVVMSDMITNQFSTEEIEELKEEMPMGRFAKPEEIAQTVLHLIHPNSSYITGQIITIAGGWY